MDDRMRCVIIDAENRPLKNRIPMDDKMRCGKDLR